MLQTVCGLPELCDLILLSDKCLDHPDPGQGLTKGFVHTVNLCLLAGEGRLDYDKVQHQYYRQEYQKNNHNPDKGRSHSSHDENSTDQKEGGLHEVHHRLLYCNLDILNICCQPDKQITGSEPIDVPE